MFSAKPYIATYYITFTMSFDSNIIMIINFISTDVIWYTQNNKLRDILKRWVNITHLKKGSMEHKYENNLSHTTIVYWHVTSVKIIPNTRVHPRFAICYSLNDRIYTSHHSFFPGKKYFVLIITSKLSILQREC